MSRFAQLKIAAFLSLRKCGVSSDVVRHLIKRYCKWFDWETKELRKEFRNRRVNISSRHFFFEVCCDLDSYVETTGQLCVGTLINEITTWRRSYQNIETLMDNKYWNESHFPSLRKHPPTVAQKYKF